MISFSDGAFAITILFIISIASSFWYKSGRIFVSAAEDMISKNQRINNEFYVDKCMDNLINMGLKVSVFEVEKSFCWGTPEDLDKFNNEHKGAIKGI